MADKCKLCFVCEEEKSEEPKGDDKPPAFLAVAISAIVILLVL